MLNYISGEFFRLKKSKLIRAILLAGLLVPAFLAFLYILSILKFSTNEYNSMDQNYLTTLNILSYLGAAIVSFTIIEIKKESNIYRTLLSIGYTKKEIFIYDYISYQLVTILIGLLIALVCIIINTLLSIFLNFSYLLGLEAFIKNFFIVLACQLVSNTAIYSLVVMVNSSALGYLLSFSFGIMFPIFSSFLQEPIKSLAVGLAGYMLPIIYYFYGNFSAEILNFKMAISAIIIFIGLLYISYKNFYKREL